MTAAKAGATFLAGTIIGSYRVVRHIRSGGMATVYEAVNPQIGKRAAIKVLLPQFCANKEVEQRFLNEARSVNLVRHPGLVDIFEYGHTSDNCTFIVMEYLDGAPLDLYLRERGPLPISAALCLGQQMAAALAAAHQKGIVHRDLKPGNVILLPDRYLPSGLRCKVLDFGIAKIAQLLGEAGVEAPQTQAGALLGTPTYMAPEQISECSSVTSAADVYSLGAILYQMLSGVPPFSGSHVAVMARKVARQAKPTPLEALNPALPKGLVALVNSLMADEATERPAMQEAEAQLRACGSAQDSIEVEIVTEEPTSAFAHLSAKPTSVEPLLGPTTSLKLDQESLQEAQRPQTFSRKQRWLRWSLATGLLFLLAGGSLAWRYTQAALRPLTVLLPQAAPISMIERIPTPISEAESRALEVLMNSTPSPPKSTAPPLGAPKSISKLGRQPTQPSPPRPVPTVEEEISNEQVPKLK